MQSRLYATSRAPVKRQPSKLPQFAAEVLFAAPSLNCVGSAHGPKKSAPSRCRLRPAIRLTSAEAGVTRRAINLGRSVLGARTTLCEVLDAGQACAERMFPQFATGQRSAAQFRKCVGSAQPSLRRSACGESSSCDRSKENAPSRWSLRPTIRLTSAEAAVTRRAINLRHSVLGASRTLGGCTKPVKDFGGGLVANCGVFFSHRSNCTFIRLLWSLERKKREPGTRARL